VLPEFAMHREALLARGVETSPALARALLEQASVACLPGTDFGRSPDELTIRLSLVDFDGEGAMTALRSRGDEPIDEAFLLARCGRVLEGIDALCDWVTRGP
jgi:aspartate/methionine/tyrosine aminotransferase